MGQDTEELKRDIEATRSDMSEKLEAIGDRVSPGRIIERKKNKMSASAQSLRARVMGTASDTQERLADTAHSALDSVTDTASHATDVIKHAPSAATSHTEGTPMVAGGIAFGLGFLLAAAFPATKSEKAAGAKVMEQLEARQGAARRGGQGDGSAPQGARIGSCTPRQGCCDRQRAGSDVLGTRCSGQHQTTGCGIGRRCEERRFHLIRR